MKPWLKPYILTAIFLTIHTAGLALGDCLGPCDSCEPPLFNGFYLGGNVGFVSYRGERVDINGFFTAQTSCPSITDSNTNWTAGVQLGYDWLCSDWLLGVVGDWNWSNAQAEVSLFQITIPTPPIGANQYISSELKWVSTYRVRTGFVFNKALFYLTGGAALAHLKTSLEGIGGGALTERFSFHHNRWGWTAGVGTEFAIRCKWTMNAEILYANIGSYSFSFFSRAFNAQKRFDAFDSFWLGRIGLNYRFSICNLCSCWR